MHERGWCSRSRALGRWLSGKMCLFEIFEREFHLPCLLEDSVRTMATAERQLGLGRDADDFILVEVGMGIGAAVFFEGKLYRGAGGKAGGIPQHHR